MFKCGYQNTLIGLVSTIFLAVMSIIWMEGKFEWKDHILWFYMSLVADSFYCVNTVWN